MFGFPTGIGALLVRNTSANLLQKSYYGGGTVFVALSRENSYVPRSVLHERSVILYFFEIYLAIQIKSSILSFHVAC